MIQGESFKNTPGEEAGLLSSGLLHSAEDTTALKVEIIGKYSAMLSVIEVALGSVLHALHIPFAGNFLSLNQGYLLCRASLEAKARGVGSVGYGVSNVAAVLKSLAPAGKKLGPMLSLSMQGFLFGLGENLFGANLLGLGLGMALLSLWTFVQPLLTFYLFFGNELWKALHYLFEKTVPYTGLGLRDLAFILAGVVLVKVGVAVGLAAYACRTKGNAELQNRLLALAKERGASPLEGEAPSRREAFRLALGDMLRPLFLVSLGITAFFLFFSQHSLAERFWILLRPVAIGFVFFYFSRTLTLDRWLQSLHGTRGEAFALATQRALAEVRKFAFSRR